MSDLDYYKVLEVSRGASSSEIRKAYRKLVRQNHPDSKPGDKAAAEKFKQIQEAYGILGDSEKRAQYDRFGTTFPGAGPGSGAGTQPTYTWTGPGGGGPIDLNQIFGGGFDFGTGTAAFDPRDSFENVFNQPEQRKSSGRRQRSRSRDRGESIRLEIEIPLQIAALGGDQDVRVQKADEVEHLTVKIPAGVKNGSVIRLSGQGKPGPAGSKPGDLLLKVKIARHAFFRSEGSDLFLDVPVSPSEAALGAKIDVPTLSEEAVTMSIPPGTASGTKLRLKEKGLPNQQSGSRGDQFCTVKIVVPKKLNADVQKLYEDLAQLEQQSPRDGLW